MFLGEGDDSLPYLCDDFGKVLTPEALLPFFLISSVRYSEMALLTGLKTPKAKTIGQRMGRVWR